MINITLRSCTLKSGVRATEPTLENCWAERVAGKILFLTINSGIWSKRLDNSVKNLHKVEQMSHIFYGSELE